MAKEDIEDTSSALSYECEKKPLKIKSEGLGSLDFMSEIAKGRFAVTANVNKDGKVFSVRSFDNPPIVNIFVALLLYLVCSSNCVLARHTV